MVPRGWCWPPSIIWNRRRQSGAVSAGAAPMRAGKKRYSLAIMRFRGGSYRLTWGHITRRLFDVAADALISLHEQSTAISGA
jgi:hypothetical protein